jgi:membrane protease YdiL (CAAX protease family)
MTTNAHAALLRRRQAGTLRWRGPGLMLFARAGFAVAAQAIAAAVFALRGSPTPWHDAIGWIVYGTLTPAYLFGQLPLPAALYGVLVWPFIWGLTEQMTYNGYLVPRFQVLCRSTGLAVAIVASVWSMQHVFMPFILDAKYIAFRLFSPLPFSVFATLVYLRLRRLIPLAIAHALMDGASVAISALMPSLSP